MIKKVIRKRCHDKEVLRKVRSTVSKASKCPQIGEWTNCVLSIHWDNIPNKEE